MGGTFWDVLEGIGKARDAIKQGTDLAIKMLLEEFVPKRAKEKLAELYAVYRRNTWISVSVNAALIAVVMAAHLFFSVTAPVVLFVSLVSVALMAWACVRLVRSVRLLYTLLRWEHFDVLPPAVKEAATKRSLSAGIRTAYRGFYEKMINKKTKGWGGIIHDTAAGLGFVSSRTKIEEAVLETYRELKPVVVRLFAYRVIALTVFYGAFLFVLRPFVFSAVLDMRLWQIPLYPFTVGLPAIVRLLRMGI
jgi:hypothetical protein